MFAKLWMVGVRRMPHFNQDTQASIESYHGALKCSFTLDTKGFRGHKIDLLVWRLTTTIARHYMHTLEMKKKGFIKKKVMKAIITQSVEKATLIPLTHVYQPTFENDGAWGVRSQHLPNVIYVVKFPFTEIFCYTCEWALRGNSVNTKLRSFSHAQTFLKMTSFIIVEHGMDHIVEGWVTCLRTHDIFQMIWSPMMMTKMNILKVMMGSWNLMGS
jgi:hypothetical protein